MTDSTEFYDWMKLNGIRRLADAADSLGIGERVALQISGGTRDLTTTERLAMTARAHGLEPWQNGEPAKEAAPTHPEPPQATAPKPRRFHHQTAQRRREGNLKRRLNRNGGTDA